MALDKTTKFLIKIFGSRNERLVKGYMRAALEAGPYEEELKQLSDEQLGAKTAEFKAALAGGQTPEDILPEAFAVVREAARRNVNMRHFDVQLIGGEVLYEGKIAEMATGEGKTLVATLAAYLVHLSGRHVHIVTVNDYLAKRDAEWMGPIYKALGMTVGAIQADMDTSGEERKNQYGCDVTYGTNNEFGFDYLRDNMKTSLEQMVQGPLQYAIIDEVDSILIDEARTPLIISGPAFDDVSRYKKADQVARQLLNLQSGYDRIKNQVDTIERKIANAEGEISDAKRDKDSARVEKAQKVIEKAEEELEAAKARLTQTVQYYEVEFDHKQVRLTNEGEKAAQDIAGIGSFYTGANMEWSHLIQQSLRAHVVFEREKDYVAMDGKIIIVDEFTGRLMHGRQWSDGLHQAVEAKEGVHGQGRDADAGHDHPAELLQALRPDRRHDRHGRHRGRRVHEDLQARRGGHPDEHAVRPRRQGGRHLQDQAREVRRDRRRDQPDQQRRPAGPRRYDQHREERRAFQRADEALRDRPRGAQRQATCPRGDDRGQGRAAIPGPGRQHTWQRHHRDEHGRSRHRYQARTGRRRNRRPAHPGHRAARSPPDRQPVARPLRPAGRCRVQPILPVLRR